MLKKLSQWATDALTSTDALQEEADFLAAELDNMRCSPQEGAAAERRLQRIERIFQIRADHTGHLQP